MNVYAKQMTEKYRNYLEICVWINRKKNARNKKHKV